MGVAISYSAHYLGMRYTRTRHVTWPRLCSTGMAVSSSNWCGTEDDWVLDSLDRYERLHVFELQEPTQCMEWSRDIAAVYVAGFHVDKHNELLQLLLPEKLLPPDKQTLLARRDFKIGRGAISNHPIHHIQCVDQMGTVLVTSGVGPTVTIWGLDSSSPDLLVATRDVATPTPTLGDPSRTELQLSWSQTHPTTLLTGSSLHSLQLLDLCTLTSSWKCPKNDVDTPLHALAFLPHTNQTFLTCSGDGELRIWDSRQPLGAQKFPKTPLPNISKEPSHPPTYAMAVSLEGSHCACLSTAGELQLYDMRGMSWQPQAACRLATKARSSPWSHFSSQRAAAKPCVQFSSSCSCLSVSGLDRGVTVYDITSWSGIVNIKTPVFKHTGHEEDTPQCEVTVHSWHPSFHSMILSCDSDGIMHAWQWKEDRTWQQT